MLNQPVRGIQSILVQLTATTSDTDATIQPDQRNWPDGSEADASAATELVTDEDAVLFRPRLRFISED